MRRDVLLRAAVLTVSLVAAIVSAWLLARAITPTIYVQGPVAPQILPFGSGYSGSPQLAKDFEQVRQNAETVIGTLNHRGAFYRSTSEYLEWCAFGLTTLLTLMAGALGIVWDGDSGGTKALIDKIESSSVPKRRRSRKRLVVAIGVLSGLSTVATSAQTKLRAKAEDTFAAAKIFRAVVDTRRASIDSAETEAGAERELTALRDYLATI